jgi:uncharacterized cofD-like protein
MGEKKQTKPKVVVIGGGTGLSVMLRGLKKKPMDITAIVTVADDGGSSGRLRSEMGMPPPGDIRNVLIALADVEPLLSQILEYRFQSGNGLAGHSLGNLILAAMKDITGDFVTAIQQLSRVLAVRGQVLPASNQAVVLHAEMEDGTIVTGESQIPNSGKKIKRVFIDPVDTPPLDESIRAIREADAILIGPGSLYTSILPNLLVQGISEEIVRSPAMKIFVCNVMTQPGETDDYSVHDHLQAIVDHVHHPLFDVVMVNHSEIPLEVQRKYAEKGASPVCLDLERVREGGYQIVADDFVIYETWLRHNADRLAHHVWSLMEERFESRS